MDIERLTTPGWALRAGLGTAAFLVGLDKFFNLPADWPGALFEGKPEVAERDQR